VASDMGAIGAVQHAAEVLVKQEGFDPDACYRFPRALREALANAITHGHGNDSKRRVKVDLQSNYEGLVFTIRDQGPGFAPGSKDGNGMLHMRQFSDQVDFSFPAEGGTIVRLERNR